MNETLGVQFLDEPAPRGTDWKAETWPPIVAPKATLEAEVARLAALPAGPRRSLIVHPWATQPGLGLTPAIQVALEVYELTIQDSPMHLAMDSLLWQENLKGQPVLLGSGPGPKTNRPG